MRESDTASRFIQGDAAHSVTLTALAGRPAIQHLFQPEHIDAINFAIACGRPVLLTGETGVGKTQLARAAAKALKRAYVRYTVDARSESRDLLWKFDAVARLADAQIASALGASKQAIQSALAAGDYLVPGPLWWGFDWAGAEALGRAERPHQADSGDPCNGVVVLIDEIDKGELEVPQGLLEALGDGGFQPEHRAMRVHATGTPPLVILTSNGEKALPDAFVRRCLVLNIELPTDEARLTGFLVERGAAHTSLKESIMRAAAKQLIADRNAAAEAGWLPLPGLAEYIDLLNVLEQSVPEDGDHLEVLDRASEYLFRKAKVLARGLRVASRGVVSRADLLRGLLEHPGGIPTALLDQLGFEHAPIYREAPSETHHAEAESVFSATAPSRNDTDPALQPFAAVPFWRATHFEREADAPDAIQHPERRPEAPTRPLSVAPLQPLCDWKSLYPRIRQMLSAPRPGYRLDEPEVVRRLGQAEALHDWPRRTQRGWGNGLYVVEDRSRHLTPYRRDQGWVSQRLSAHYAKTEFAQALFFPGMSAPMQALGYGEDGRTRFAPMMLRAGDRVLVLGDLGVLHRDPAAMRVWQRFGRRLKAQGAHGIALVPFAPARCPIELRPYFDLLSWEYPDPPWLDEEDRERHGESLLDRLALIGCVDPAILRALRLAQRHPSLPAAIESWIWQHESQAEADTVSTAIRDDQVRQRRDRLASQPEAVAQALAAIARSGQAVPYTFLIEAAISHAGVLDRVSEGEGARRLLKRALSDAPQLFDYIGGSLNATEGSGLPGHERAYLDGLQQRLPDEVRTDPRYRHACRLLDNAARAWREDREPPRPLKAPRNIEIDQRGDQFRCRWQEPGVVRASPLATLRSRDGQIEFELDSEDRFWKDGIAPAWVDICGYDEYGPWVEFTVDGVTQRMRWIPPGRFLMGSPEDEPGRYSDEGPQHEVTVEQGFWMFDTPVTQALWEVVMTDNPAKFRSPTRPVESVRWEDAQTFIERLNERLPGLVLELPSEARWEYACRAGTDTALYSGPIEILGENNAPALDAIAWYGGNSGVGFELDNGWDSSEWPERQYPHDKAGTRPVGMKAANDWGLFDMLGNVDEWVADAWYGYDGKPADAGARQGEAGGGRVVRGGSWRGDARSVRCAVRFRFLPGLRGGLLGFRCARVQGGAEPATDGAARQAERRVHSPGRGGAAGRADARRFGVHLRLDAPADGAGAEIPDAPRLIVRTDLERLVLERLPRDTQWADEMGRDRHGLWAEFEYRGVRQRLRWIPPGRFQMGSPGDEPGRMEREGPQHEVTLARGYWLFDTPVTQALWMAVMGDNPARFQSPTRPVEQVDFVATKQFIDRINATVPALGLVLPSEAQWEYASRAGTQTALYSGSIDILGVNNAPALDSIAWYGGNSGVGFELDNGVDVTGFSDRQYPQYKKAGTHPVKGKAPNPWGLYDMLANVWEWTEDGWHENYAGAPNDGAVWEGKAGGLRVVRGGSWYDYARNVRCAIRYHSHPGSRDGLLGFRCARVQA